MHHGGTDPAGEQAGVLEDRQQRAEGGRGERDRDGDLGVDRARQSDDPDRDQSSEQARQPRPAGPAPTRAGQLLELDLVAGEQEQHAQSQLLEELDGLGGLGQVQHVRADHDAQRQQNHDLGNQLARHQTGEEGRQHGAQHDPEQRGRGGLHGTPPVSPGDDYRTTPGRCRVLP
jgi:hypothetical protein